MVFVKKGCSTCGVELDEGQTDNINNNLAGIWPTKCFKCGKDLENL